MFSGKQKNLFLVALALSVLLHAIMFGALFAKRHHNMPNIAAKTPVKIVNAVAINQQDIEQEVAKIESKKEHEKQQRLDEIARYKKTLASAKQQQKKAEKRVANLNHKQNLLDQRINKAKRLALQQENAAKKEKKKLAELKHQQEKLDRAMKQRALKHKQSLKAKEEKRKQLAALKKKQQEAKHKMEEALRKKKHQEALEKLAKKRRDAVDKALQDQMKSEQQRLASIHDKEVASEVAKYKAKIVAVIGRSWLIPDKVDKSLACQLTIHLGPGGVVLDVQVSKSSGDAVLDRSAKTAVLKASPLPVPSDKELFNQFRDLRLTVRPEQVKMRG